MVEYKNKDAFFALIRLGIGHSAGYCSRDFDWSEIESIAAQQELSAILIDGVEKMPDKQRPPKEILLQWIGNTLQGYEYRYENYRRVIAEMAGWYNAHGFKMMVLKGYACSINWPKPEHRPCGDIDIWLFGKQKEADLALAKEKGIDIDRGHHHHTVFNWSNFVVENHYDFLNVFHHKSNVELESILKDLGKDDTHFVELYGEKVYLPSPNLHALFILRHAMSNYASTGLKLRQLLDWAFFVKLHRNEIDWAWLIDVVEKFGMKPLFQIFNAICVENLGFESSIFPTVQFEPVMKERVLNEILSREFPLFYKGNFISRILFKYRRWKGSAWKHELCYNESLWSAFWSGVKLHIMKPSSI